jgi:hypothetical protein
LDRLEDVFCLDKDWLMHSASSLGKIKDGLAWLEIPSWLV